MPIILAEPDSFTRMIQGENPFFWFRLGESSGSTATNEVGANGTYINTPSLGESSLVRGESDTAVRFDSAQSERVSLPTSLRIGNKSSFSLEAFVKIHTLAGGTSNLIYGEGGSGIGQGLIMYFSIGGGNVLVFNMWTGSNNNAISSGTLDVGNTYHVAITFSAANRMRIYINGSLDGTHPNASPGILTAGDISIGAGRNTSHVHAWFSDETIDEVIAYSYELSSAQVAAHAQYLTP